MLTGILKQRLLSAIYYPELGISKADWFGDQLHVTIDKKKFVLDTFTEAEVDNIRETLTDLENDSLDMISHAIFINLAYANGASLLRGSIRVVSSLLVVADPENIILGFK